MQQTVDINAASPSSGRRGALSEKVRIAESVQPVRDKPSRLTRSCATRPVVGRADRPRQAEQAEKAHESRFAKRWQALTRPASATGLHQGRADDQPAKRRRPSERRGAHRAPGRGRQQVKKPPPNTSGAGTGQSLPAPAHAITAWDRTARTLSCSAWPEARSHRQVLRLSRGAAIRWC